MRRAAKKQVEVYIGNVPHGTLAPDLAKFLQGSVLRLSSPSPALATTSILRCEVKRNAKATFAFVVLRSREIADVLQSYEDLVFGGRTLRIRPSKARFRRPMGTAPGFRCGGLQLCVQWPPGDLTCLWAVKSGVTFQVKVFCRSA
ncbi:unnamed protein product [Ectocarpus sp. CCAP 1310/34]|nr:unnamed protein product [Ectocarpus sp. CCAP 1310/34]